jgi:hypothetical protein
MAPGGHDVGIPIRAFAGSLYLLPPAFRREFGEEMTCDFADSVADTADTGPRPAPLFLLVRAVLDLLRSAPRLWLESGLPFIVAAAAILGLIVAATAARLRPTALPVPDLGNDRDVRTLILLVAVVIVVIANTLIVSLWFLRPLLTRDRKLTACSKRVI